MSFVQHHLCASSDEACHLATSRLSDALYFGFDFDMASDSIVISAVLDARSHREKQNETLELRNPHRHEIGILKEEPSKRAANEMSFSGLLTVVGVDDRPSKLCKMTILLREPY